MSIPVAPKYIADFEQLGFGMFVHWGLYSQLGRGEWIYHIGKLDANEYKKLKDSFTAEDFNAEDLVLTAKRAGCKYITLTTRHHEGFSLYEYLRAQRLRCRPQSRRPRPDPRIRGRLQ